MVFMITTEDPLSAFLTVISGLPLSSLRGFSLHYTKVTVLRGHRIYSGESMSGNPACKPFYCTVLQWYVPVRFRAELAIKIIYSVFLLVVISVLSLSLPFTRFPVFCSGSL